MYKIWNNNLPFPRHPIIRLIIHLLSLNGFRAAAYKTVRNALSFGRRRSCEPEEVMVMLMMMVVIMMMLVMEMMMTKVILWTRGGWNGPNCSQTLCSIPLSFVKLYLWWASNWQHFSSLFQLPELNLNS